MTDQIKNAPAAELRDGHLVATIWKNASKNGSFYSVEISRSYEDPASTLEKPIYKVSHSFSGSDISRASTLMQWASQKALELRHQDKLNEQKSKSAA